MKISKQEAIRDGSGTYACPRCWLPNLNRVKLGDTSCPTCGVKLEWVDRVVPDPPAPGLDKQVVALLKATGNRPRVHGNGFIQLDLTPTIRLHVWGDPRIPKQTTETPIHDHTFGFTSYVLVGAIENIIYGTRPDPAPNDAFIPHRATVRVGEDTVLSPQGDATEIFIRSQRVIEAGECYSMVAGEIHQSRPIGVTLSVIVKTGPSLAQGGASPTVFVPSGVTPDNEFNRYAAPSELLWDIITSAVQSVARAADNEAIAPYLKDGETVLECVERNRRDLVAVVGLLARLQADNETLKTLVDSYRNTFIGESNY